MKPHSITLRITLWFALLSSAILLVLAVYLFRSLHTHFAEIDSAELVAKAALVRRILSQLDSESQINTSPLQSLDVLSGQRGLYVALRSEDERLLYSSSMQFQVPREAWGETAEIDQPPTFIRVWRPTTGQYYRVTTAWAAIGQRGNQRARVVLALDASHHFEVVHGYRHTLVLALLVGLATAALLGWWIVRKELAGLRQLAATAQRVSASRLKHHLDPVAYPAEIQPLVAAFNTMLMGLEESFSRLSDFSSDLAHEIRNPIHRLLTSSQVALSRSRETQEYREVLESNIEELEHLSKMVEDMLFLARADKASAVLKPEDFALRDEVETVCAYFEPLIDERGLTVQCEGNASLFADRLLVRRAVSNLMSNAVRHADSDSTIRVDIKHDNGRVEIAVTNSGPGIAPDMQERVFDRFFQLDLSQRRGHAGSGLGLAIVRSIMQLHDGTIRVASSSAGPTTFTASFPA